MCKVGRGQLAILFVVAESRRAAPIAALLRVVVGPAQLITPSQSGGGYYLMIL